MPTTDTKLVPATAEEMQRLGWRMQRATAARERAEAAQWAKALATGRIVRGGTYSVTLPREYSGDEDHGAVLDEHGRQVLDVTLPRSTVADPADRWTARQLASTAMRQADKARRSIRPRPSREAAQDAAADVVADILAKRYGTLPLRRDVTTGYLWQRARGRLIDAATVSRADRTAREDANGLPDAAEIAEELISGGMRRANGDRDPMLSDPYPDAYGRAVPGTGAEADPVPVHWHLADREAVAAAHAAGMLTGPEAADRLGVKPSSVRVYLQRSRDALRQDGPDALAARIAADAATVTEDEATARLMSDAPSHHGRPLIPWPDRTEDGLEHPVMTYRPESDAHTDACTPPADPSR